MGSSKKRKRNVLDTPRITYDTPTRIFDRLFKEESLDEVKETVRKKLGVPSSTAIHLSQLRDGTVVDLEDDDDFEAFQSAAYSTSVARVKVVVSDADQPVHADDVEQVASQAEVVEPISFRKLKKKRKKKPSSDSSRAATSTTPPVTEDAPDLQVERPTKKRRVSFAAPSTGFLSNISDPKKTKKSRNTDKPAESKNSSADTSLAAETSDVLSEKKSKKKKRDKSLEAEPHEESMVAKTSNDKKKKKKDKEKEKDSTGASALDVTTDAEVGRKGSKSKKRARSSSLERSTEMTTTTEPGSLISASADTSRRLAKKSKKIAQDLETTQDKRSHQNDTNREPAPVPAAAAAAAEPSTESPTMPPKAKKEKKNAAPKDAEQPVEASAPASSSSPDKDAPVEEPVVVDKKLKKKKSKADLDTEKISKVAPPAESALPKGKKGDLDFAKAPEKAQPAASAIKPSEESTSAPTSTTSTADRATHIQNVAEETSNVMAAKILALVALKKLAAAKDTATASETTTPVPPKTTVAIEASSSSESTTSTAPETTTSAPPKTTAAIEAPSSKKSTATPTSDTNSSHADKPNAPTPAQNKSAAGTSAAKPPKLTAAEKKKAPCPFCGESPFHARTNCPIIKSGIRAMRKRIIELEATNADEHAEVIEELHAFIDKRSKKIKAPAAHVAQTKDNADAHSEVDNNASSKKPVPIAPSTKAAPATSKPPAKAAPPPQPEPPELPSYVEEEEEEEESPPLEPSRSTQTRPTAPKSPAALSKGPSASSSQEASSQKPQQKQKSVPKKSEGYDKDSSQLLDTSDVSLATIGLAGGLLGYGAGDISAFTENDIEALIRGPRPSLNSKNLAFSSSSSDSEDEDELEPDVVMEDDEEKDEKAQRVARRMSKMPAQSESSDEEVVVGVRGQEQEDDDDDDANSSSAGDVTLQRDIIAASKVHASVTPSARACEDIPNEPSPSLSTSSPSDLRAEERSFQEVNKSATSQVLDASVNDVVNDIISADIGPVSSKSEIEKGEVEDRSQDSEAGAMQVNKSTSKVTTTPEVVTSGDREPAAADSPSFESSESTADTNEADPIEVEAPQPNQGDPIHSDAGDDGDDVSAQAQSTPKAQVAARRTRSQRNKVNSANAGTDTLSTPDTSAASQPSQSGSGSGPPKVTRKAARPMTKISELPVPPHPNSSVRIIRPAQVAAVARTTRSKSAAAPEPEKGEDEGGAAPAPTSAPDPEANPEREPKPQTQTETETQPEPSIVRTRSGRVSVVPKTPAKTPLAKTPAKMTRATLKQALTSSQTAATATTSKPAPKTPAKPPSKAATQTPAAKPLPKVAAKGAAFTRMIARTRARQLSEDLEEEPDDGEGEEEEQNTTINGHAPAQGGREAGDKSLALWDVLPDRSSQAPDLTGVSSSPTRNMVDQLVSSPRAATPKAGRPSQQADADAQGGDGEGTEEAWQLRQDPLFLYDESQQSFPYSQYPGLVPKRSQEDSDDGEEEEVESSILNGLTERPKPRPSGPFRGLTEISSQSRREFFTPRYSSQIANIGKPAVKDMYGGLPEDDDDEGSDGSDSEGDSEAERKANNSHIPETRRAGLSSKRK